MGRSAAGAARLADGVLRFYKSGKLGHNETYFKEWTVDVLNQVRKMKDEVGAFKKPSECPCS